MLKPEAVNKRILSMGLKKSYVANRIGISAVHFSNYINGKNNLSVDRETELKAFLSL
jgi:predicted transcriptional regulator